MCKIFCTFAADMRKTLAIIAILALCVCAHAETVILRTGARVKGTIVFQNEEVVIIRDTKGARFQYPRAEVEQILTDEVEEEEAVEEEAAPKMPNKKAQIILELAGGPSLMPHTDLGGAMSVDLLVGSHHIGDRHLFIGGGLGYHGIFMGHRFNFLPIQLALRMPFIEAKHAPTFGASLGYGIALSKSYLGGIYAGIDFGYRYQINPRSAITLSAFVQIQQAKAEQTEVVRGTGFVNKTGVNILTPGIKFALYF